jgi:hypothetical protein
MIPAPVEVEKNINNVMGLPWLKSADYWIRIKRAMKKILVTGCWIVLVAYLYGQDDKKIELIETATITRLNSYFIEYNMRKTEFPGWRIQVFVSSDRKEMENAIASFRNKFPGYSAKWLLNDPYYIVRAGVFTEYAEAMKALSDIRKSFRSSTLVTDRIKREEIY